MATPGAQASSRLNVKSSRFARKKPTNYLIHSRHASKTQHIQRSLSTRILIFDNCAIVAILSHAGEILYVSYVVKVEMRAVSLRGIAN